MIKIKIIQIDTMSYTETMRLVNEFIASEVLELIEVRASIAHGPNKYSHWGLYTIVYKPKN